MKDDAVGKHKTCPSDVNETNIYLKSKNSDEIKRFILLSYGILLGQS